MLLNLTTRVSAVEVAKLRMWMCILSKCDRYSQRLWLKPKSHRKSVGVANVEDVRIFVGLDCLQHIGHQGLWYAYIKYHMYHVSNITYIKYRVSHVSCITCITYHVSYILYHVSCMTYPCKISIMYYISHVSCIMYDVSHIMYHVSQIMYHSVWWHTCACCTVIG